MVTIDVFKFSELTPQAKKIARDWYIDKSECDNDNIRTDLKEAMRDILCKAGFTEMQIGYNLNYCQGDGVAFFGKIDLNEYLAARDGRDLNMINVSMCDPKFDPYKLSIVDKIRLTNKHPELGEILKREKCKVLFTPLGDQCVNYEIRHIGRYYHKNSMEVEADTRLVGADSLIGDIHQEITAKIKDLSYEMEKKGYEIIDWYHSDEYVDEQCEQVALFNDDGVFMEWR